MKRLILQVIILMTALLLLSTIVFAQEVAKYDMGKMQMVFLSPASGWKTKSAKKDKQLRLEHRKYVDTLIESGKCAIAGPAAGDGPLQEILVFKIESAEEVKAMTTVFPAVKAGMMTADVISWFAARNYIMAPERPLKSSKYVFGLLVRGEKWTPEKTPETEKIQEGHMANINRLGEAGKLVLAGPFYDDGARRGVFIFKVESLKEAQTLTETDPAVIAGRLKIELYHWTVPKGTLK